MSSKIRWMHNKRSVLCFCLQFVLENSSREDKHECPFARSSIQLTLILCEILRIGEPRQSDLLHTAISACSCSSSNLFCVCSQPRRRDPTTTPSSSVRTGWWRSFSVSAFSCSIRPGKRWEPHRKTLTRYSSRGARFARRNSVLIHHASSQSSHRWESLLSSSRMA